MKNLWRLTNFEHRWETNVKLLTIISFFNITKRGDLLSTCTEREGNDRLKIFDEVFFEQVRLDDAARRFQGGPE